MNIPEAKRPPEAVLARIHALEGKKGMFAVIEPETGDYFLGKTLMEALRNAKESHPGKVFYSIRIGHSFLFEHKGGFKRV